MTPMESTLAVAFAGLATIIALGYIQLPPAFVQSSLTQAFMLVVALVLFAYSPVVGVAAIVCFVIILYTRNLQKTSMYAKRVATAQYGEETIPKQPVQVAQGYSGSTGSEPREYGMEGYQTNGPVGQFPLQDDRPFASGGQVATNTYMYRPSDSMGDDTFQRIGPDIDEKMAAFAY